MSKTTHTHICICSTIRLTTPRCCRLRFAYQRSVIEMNRVHWAERMTKTHRLRFPRPKFGGILGCRKPTLPATCRTRCRVAARRCRLCRCCRRRRCCRVAADDGQTVWSETTSQHQADRWHASCSAQQGRRATGTAADRYDTCLSSRL